MTKMEVPNVIRVIGMTKVKMSKEDETSVQSEFVEKRRAALERYLNRTATHPNLR